VTAKGQLISRKKVNEDFPSFCTWGNLPKSTKVRGEHQQLGKTRQDYPCERKLKKKIIGPVRLEGIFSPNGGGNLKERGQRLLQGWGFVQGGSVVSNCFNGKAQSQVRQDEGRGHTEGNGPQVSKGFKN